MTSSTKEPKLFVVAGCLRGITALMVNFTKTMQEGVRAHIFCNIHLFHMDNEAFSMLLLRQVHDRCMISVCL